MDSEQGFAISLPECVQEGSVVEWEASAAQIFDVTANFDRLFQQAIDPGELEALACLLARPQEGIGFCSSDGPAIRALAMLDMADRGLSFEVVLKLSGFAKPLPRHFTERFFQEQLRLGSLMRITGQGLSPTSRFRP
jgi:hypothetical protein